jgi:hypothetical protein
MDEQLKTKLVGYLEAIEAKVRTGSDFVADEAPNVVKEWLWWCGVESGLYATFFMLAAMFAFCVLRYASRALAREADENQGDSYYSYNCFGWSRFFGWLAVIGAPLFLIGTATHMVRVAKVIVAPRVVVIEKVAELTGLSKQK